MSVFKLSIVIAILPICVVAQDNTIPTHVSNCVSCHSANGNPLVAGTPILAGQRPDYLTNAIIAYRDGQRTGGHADVMKHIVKDLTQDEIQEIVKWFSEN